MTQRIRFLLAVLATATPVLGVAHSARGDVVPADYEAPPPPNCPAGSVPRTSHHGDAACVPAPTTCADGQRCPDDIVCTPTRFCLAERHFGRARLDVIVGQCAADGSCAEGTCNIARRCAEPRARRATNGAGCDVAGAPREHGSGFSVLLCVVLLGAALRRPSTVRSATSHTCHPDNTPAADSSRHRCGTMRRLRRCRPYDRCSLRRRTSRSRQEVAGSLHRRRGSRGRSARRGSPACRSAGRTASHTRSSRRAPSPARVARRRCRRSRMRR